MAWHPECDRIDSPNFGYPRGTHGQLRANIIASNGGGSFFHSVVGSWQAARDRFLNPAEQASAHFIIRQQGRPIQMVNSEDCAWHAGGQIHDDPLPGGPVVGDWGNLFFHGFEFEGGPIGNVSEPLTRNQIDWGIKLCRWLYEIGEWPHQVFVPRETLWEHNWVYPTACPSGRIPWPPIIEALEDDMTQDEFNAMAEVWFKAISGGDSAGQFIQNVGKSDTATNKRIADHEAKPHQGTGTGAHTH